MIGKIFLALIVFGNGMTAVDMPPQNPVIGIFTMPTEDKNFVPSTYIGASYVKFVEMAGGQVVPLYKFDPISKIMSVLQKINGVIFPGGYLQIDIKE